LFPLVASEWRKIFAAAGKGTPLARYIISDYITREGSGLLCVEPQKHEHLSSLKAGDEDVS
jgi:hypothetical protein